MSQPYALAHRSQRTRGNAGIEFTLAGIPLIFVLISTVEMARGMWTYNSLGHAAREGSRYASRVGENCSTLPNGCASSVSTVALRIQAAAVGVPTNDLNVTLTSPAGVLSCSPVTVCLEDESVWPPVGGNAVGAEITIGASYRFRPAIAMYWPGASGSSIFGSFLFEASSSERIQF